jgi:hypothetical protein
MGRRRPCGKQEEPIQDGGGSLQATALDSSVGGACALQAAVQGLQAAALEPIGSGAEPVTAPL